MMSVWCKAPMLRLLLKSCIDVLLQKVYVHVTLGVQFKMKSHVAKYQTSLKLDETCGIMKGVN